MEKKMTKIVIITIPRYMLLKAYYWMIKSQKSRAIKMLKKVKKLSEKMENKLILIWAQHCEKVSFNIRNNTCVFKIKIIY